MYDGAVVNAVAGFAGLNSIVVACGMVHPVPAVVGAPLACISVQTFVPSAAPTRK